MTTLSTFNENLKHYPEIPKTLAQDGWKKIPIVGSNEELVPLGSFAGDPHSEYKPYSKLFTDSMYFAQHDTSPYDEGQLKGALLTCFARKSVADALVKAQDLLPEGLAFVVWDSFRPQEVQGALFEDYRSELMTKDGQSLEEATKNAQQFVSIPSDDPTCPPPHNTGASVDLGLVRFTPEAWQELQELNSFIECEDDPDQYYAAEMKRMQLYRNAEALNMGTRFDEMSPKVATRYFEDKLASGELTSTENEILMNRRMLVDVMGRVGLSNYAEEWFHFDGDNQFKAQRMGVSHAVIGSAKLSDQNLAHEEMRRNHRIGSEYHRTNNPRSSKLSAQPSEHPLADLVRTAARETGALGEAPRLQGGDKLVFHPPK